MGGGGKKHHQAFTIAPAAPTAGPATTTAGGDVEDPVVSEIPIVDEPVAEEPPTAAAAEEEAAGAGGELPAQWDRDSVITPIPDTLTVGDPTGTALAVGGGDLDDGSATLMSYADPNGTSHEVLLCTLSIDGEDKLLDALIPHDAPQIPVEVETTVTGRLPLDTDNNLHEQLAKVAKSINHHLSDGTNIPAHTHDNLAAIATKIDELSTTTTAGADVAMLEQYSAAVQACQERCSAGYDVTYSAGGKIGFVHPYEHTGPATITKMVPDPNWQGDGLPTTQRTASRIAAQLDGGTATWNGHSRDDAFGQELHIDLGDGYSAIYRPSTLNAPGSSAASLHRTLEISAPAGAGHQHELVARLGELNVVNRPMTHTEAEYAYLSRNIYAHELDKHPAVAGAQAEAAGLDDLHEHQLFTERAHHAVGLDDAGLKRFARQLRLDAEAAALGDKVTIMRSGIATALKFGDASAMVNHPTYKPTPTRVGGWLHWDRINAPSDSTFANKALIHRVTGNNLADVFRTGHLVSTERRRTMGITSSKGMSETADQKSGGARGVFLRMRTTAGATSSGPCLVWDKPTKILGRTDWYGYNGDHFGAAIAGTGHSVSGQTHNPAKAAKFTAGNNEIIVANGLDLCGADAPSRVICSNSKERKALIAQLCAAGITKLGDTGIDKVITTS